MKILVRLYLNASSLLKVLEGRIDEERAEKFDGFLSIGDKGLIPLRVQKAVMKQVAIM